MLFHAQVVIVCCLQRDVRFSLVHVQTQKMEASKLTFLYLSEQDVINTGLTLSEAVELCTASFEEHGAKRIANPPRVLIHPLPDAILHAMPGTYQVLVHE